MEHDRLKATRIDLLSELHSPSFWRNVASINQDLTAYSSEKPGDIPPGYHPDKLTQDFSTCYFDPHYLGEAATVTIAHELPDGGLGVEQTNGELGPFTHTTVSTEECVAGVDITTEQRVVALAIGEKAIPLSPETLLQLDVDKLTSNEQPKDTFSYILSQVHEIDTLLTKRRYQTASPKEQAMLIQNTLDNINNYLDVIANDNTVSIITLHPSLRYDNDTINAQHISVMMEGDYPYFKIVDLNDITHVISRDNINDIEITDDGCHTVLPKPDHDLIEDLHNTAALATELIKSKEFANARLGQQQKMLEDVIDEARLGIHPIFATSHLGNLVSCITSKYWAVEANAYKSGSYSPEEIAALPAAMSEPSEEPFEVCGDTISLVIPEMAEREEKITSIADFPLSQGQPMLQIKDASGSGLVYLIPIESVSGIMPFTWSDETKD